MVVFNPVDNQIHLRNEKTSGPYNNYSSRSASFWLLGVSLSLAMVERGATASNKKIFLCLSCYATRPNTCSKATETAAGTECLATELLHVVMRCVLRSRCGSSVLGFSCEDVFGSDHAIFVALEDATVLHLAKLLLREIFTTARHVEDHLHSRQWILWDPHGVGCRINNIFVPWDILSESSVLSKYCIIVVGTGYKPTAAAASN